MAQELSIFSPGSQVPAHILERMKTLPQNIKPKVTVPSLSITGKVFSVNVNGKTTQLMTRDAEGESVPVQVFNAVILDYAAYRGRAFYEGTYEKDKTGRPVCWSSDGKAPHASVPADQKQANKCDVCPKSAKGSRVSENGKAGVACSQHRMLAVIPATKLDFPALRLKIAITSDYDKETELPHGVSPNGRWFAFQQYRDVLRDYNVGTTAAFVTKIKFQADEAYPKLLFSGGRQLTDEEMDIVAEKAASDEVKKLISGEWTPEGADGVPASDLAEDGLPKWKPAPAEETAKATKPAATEVIEDAEFVDLPATEPVKATKAVDKAPKAPKKAAAPKPEVVQEADLPDEISMLLAGIDDM